MHSFNKHLLKTYFVLDKWIVRVEENEQKFFYTVKKRFNTVAVFPLNAL